MTVTQEQKEMLINAIQFIGFALTENAQEQLETVTALGEALIRNNWTLLENIYTEDKINE